MIGLWFEHPEWLAVCTLALGGLATALAASRALSRRRLRALVGSSTPGRSPLADTALLAALALTTLALLGPRLARETVWIPPGAVDLVLLMDTSRSMDARDTPPSRIDRARRAAVEILERMTPGSRVALAAFAGRGVLLTPLTPDAAALIELVPGLQSDLIEPGGSDLQAGIRAALGAFDATSERARAIFVLSDGEALPLRGSLRSGSGGGGDELGAVEAARRGVRILAAALGSERGATIPDRGLPLRDRGGRVVETRRRTGALARLSAATGGSLFTPDEWGEFDVPAAVREIERDARSDSGEPLALRRATPVVIPLAGLAFAMLAIEATLGGASRRRTPRRLPAPAAAVLGVTAACIGIGAAGQPEEAPRDRRFELARSDAERLELGLADARAKRWDEASIHVRAVAASATDPELEALAHHDLGVLALQREDFEAARDHFFDALSASPRDRRAQFNLEWTLRRLASNPPDADPEPAGQEPSPVDEAENAAASLAEADRSKAEPDRSEAEASRPVSELEAATETRERGREARSGPPPLRDADRDRWLARVKEDPSRALRSAAADGSPTRGAAGPAW